jgi:pimeloyl-ACP methyl ester carboxylesterase
VIVNGKSRALQITKQRLLQALAVATGMLVAGPGSSAPLAGGKPHPMVSAQGAMTYDPQIIGRNLLSIGEGRRLSVNCVGKGYPAVVFMQGGDESILDWRKVEKPIASVTRVCFYNRAGFGYSDPPSGPVTALSETGDLHALLRRAHIDMPAVLVGQSIGGFYATMYADRFPADVAGLVLVDPGFAGQMNETQKQRKIDMENSRRGDERLLLCASLAKQGRMSLDNTRGCIGFPAPVSSAETAYLSYMVTHPYWYEAEFSQSRNFYWAADGGPSLDTLQEQAVRRTFGDMPIIVLSSDQMPREPWQDDVAFQQAVDVWRAGHDQLAARSARGKSFVVPNSDHFIQRTRPDVVIAAIKEIVADARACRARDGGR